MKLGYSQLQPHESVEDFGRECFYIICYPKGDTNRLAVAEAQDFDVPDYNMASKTYFHDEQIAESYARKLAQENGLEFEGSGALLD